MRPFATQAAIFDHRQAAAQELGRRVAIAKGAKPLQLFCQDETDLIERRFGVNLETGRDAVVAM